MAQMPVERVEELCAWQSRQPFHAGCGTVSTCQIVNRCMAIV